MVFVIYFARVSPFVDGFTFYCKKIKAWNFSKQRPGRHSRASAPARGAARPRLAQPRDGR